MGMGLEVVDVPMDVREVGGAARMYYLGLSWGRMEASWFEESSRHVARLKNLQVRLGGS
jgi:hypothetical protein